MLDNIKKEFSTRNPVTHSDRHCAQHCDRRADFTFEAAHLPGQHWYRTCRRDRRTVGRRADRGARQPDLGTVQSLRGCLFITFAAVIGVMAGLAGKSGAFQNISPRWLSTIIGAVFFFSLTVFILAFMNSTTDETGYTSFPSMAGLFASYSVVFVIALLAGGAIGYFLMQGAGYAGLWGLITGVLAAIISAPMAAYVFGGVTGSGTDLLVAAFRASGANIVASVMAQGVVSDPFDKMLSFMIVWLILRSMPARLKAR